MTPEAESTELASFEQVEAYLRAHPTLLADHPALLATQRPPASEDGTVINLQHYLVRRLQQENALLRATYEELVRSCRDNLSTQVQIHDGIISILATETFDDLMQVLGVDLARLFAVDAVRLYLEAEIAPEDDRPEEHPLYGIAFLRPGDVRRLMGDQAVRLTTSPDVLSVLFPDCSGIVNSAALLRLHLDAFDRIGVLAFGAREEERYAPGQGTELLAFLASVIALRMTACLTGRAI